MGRKRKGDPINGWIVLDKPLGLSSSQAVSRVRRFLNAAKAGHGGTLDPAASGILPIALGEATKTVSYAMDGMKTYQAKVAWGRATTTDDREGETLEEHDHRPDRSAIEAALSAFVGDLDQVPPIFSAIKVDGRRAYALARAHKDVELAARPVHIAAIELMDVPDPDHAVLEVRSGKGVYMRSLARDLARHLGTVGHLAALRRTVVGPFSEIQAISLDKLESLGHIAARSDALLPVETVLADIPALALTDQEARKLKHGQPVPVLPVASRSPLKNVGQGDVVCAMADGRLVALARIQGGEVRPLRVIND